MYNKYRCIMIMLILVVCYCLLRDKIAVDNNAVIWLNCPTDWLIHSFGDVALTPLVRRRRVPERWLLPDDDNVYHDDGGNNDDDAYHETAGDVYRGGNNDDFW